MNVFKALGSTGEISSYGWATYNDSQYTQASPLSVTGRTVLPNDSTSAAINQLKAPFSNHNFISNGQFVPRDSGDAYLLRLSFSARSATTNNALTIELDIGGTQGVIYEDRKELDPNAGVYRLVTLTMPIYALGTFITNNGTFYVESDEPIDISDIILFVNPVSS